MLVITNMRDPRCSITFCYHITKPIIPFPRYTPNIVYPANYVPTVGDQNLGSAFNWDRDPFGGADVYRSNPAIFQPYTNPYLWVGRCRDTSCINTCVSFDLRQRISFRRTWNLDRTVARNSRRWKDQMAQTLHETLLLLANVGFEFEGQKSSFILNRWRWIDVLKMPSWDTIRKSMEVK